jgi:hypothetical protein
VKHNDFEIKSRLEQLRHEAETEHLLNPTRVSLRHWLATTLIILAQRLEPEIAQPQLKSR